MKNLRIIFMGTPEFAVPTLEAILEKGFRVVAVVTAPDRPAGRGLKPRASAVKECALKHNLELLQPENLKDEDFISKLSAYRADLQLVVAFRMLPEIVWNMPRLGTVNLHASLLPQYRGAAPINWAIINGEQETGLTTFFLAQKIDTGNIILREKHTIYTTDSAADLHDRLKTAGALLMVRTLEEIESGTVSAVSQQSLIGKDTQLKTAPRILKEHCRIDFNRNAGQVHDLVRGLSPYPSAFTHFVSPEGKAHHVKILSTKAIAGTTLAEPGSVITDGKHGLSVACRSGRIDILFLQLEGKKAMPVEDFLRGFAMDERWKAL